MQGEIKVTQIMINGTPILISKVSCKVAKDLTIYNTRLLLCAKDMIEAKYLIRNAWVMASKQIMNSIKE